MTKKWLYNIMWKENLCCKGEKCLALQILIIGIRYPKKIYKTINIQLELSSTILWWTPIIKILSVFNTDLHGNTCAGPENHWLVFTAGAIKHSTCHYIV